MPLSSESVLSPLSPFEALPSEGDSSLELAPESTAVSFASESELVPLSSESVLSPDSPFELERSEAVSSELFPLF